MSPTEDLKRVNPFFIYGTAWKEDETGTLVAAAIGAGFRAIDTACQRKHYHERGVGDGLQRVYDASALTRDALFLQTKYTFQRGQDERLPYDPNAPVAEQVAQSFTTSLQNLRTTRIDSLVLHGPTLSAGLHDKDLEAWAAMERLVNDGQVGVLGVSNVSADQLRLLCDAATIKPRFVQNRCYAQRYWDADVRAICKANGATYQGFSLLTANAHVLKHDLTTTTARRYNATPAQIVFRLARHLDMLPLTGTTDAAHMVADLEALSLEIEPTELDALARV